MKDKINLSIEPEDKEFLQEHPEINASGALRSYLRKLKKAID